MSWNNPINGKVLEIDHYYWAKVRGKPLFWEPVALGSINHDVNGKMFLIVWGCGDDCMNQIDPVNLGPEIIMPEELK